MYSVATENVSSVAHMWQILVCLYSKRDNPVHKIVCAECMSCLPIGKKAIGDGNNSTV